ncbi:MAG: hypothetical protein K0R92_1112 [Lachnospiraceae bacterium]|jgi:hypothetical protein|nr:hypothetical protein [Anaerocolumna sp.]MDF2609638.1 hypothetical protein [Lachnospiraceae bacterium]
MKKFGKFLFGTLSLATLAAGIYYLYKNLINKDSSDDFDEFEDDFEEYESEDKKQEEPYKKDGREYVSINITSDTVKTTSADSELSNDESSPEDESAE